MSTFATVMGMVSFAGSIVLALTSNPQWATMQAVGVLWYIVSELREANDRNREWK